MRRAFSTSAMVWVGHKARQQQWGSRASSMRVVGRLRCAELIEWNGMEWHGMAWHGMAWHGMAWHGLAWSRHGMRRAAGMVRGAAVGAEHHH